MRKLILIPLIICLILTMIGCANPALEHLLQGDTYLYQQQFDAAITEYSKAIELDPEYAVAYNNRGRAYYEQGELDSAISDFDKAIELDPELVESLVSRGLTYWNKGQRNLALSDLIKLPNSTLNTPQPTTTGAGLILSRKSGV